MPRDLIENAAATFLIDKLSIRNTMNKKIHDIQFGKRKMRKSGIDIIGNIPWGTHLCQFYETARVKLVSS